jgi:hypothetical protein
VSVLFHDTPPLNDDPQTICSRRYRVIAEYERAKIAERYRRASCGVRVLAR